MWPFSARAPLSTQNLPIPDTWEAFKGHDPQGKPMTVRAHSGYNKFNGVAGYIHHVSIAVPLMESDHEGFPTPGETEALTRIENDICEVFEPNLESIFVASITVPGIQEYVLYTRDPEAAQHKFDNDLLARVFTHRAHIHIRPDKDWQMYKKLF
jgi:Family of unknown function (DUF695)